MASTQLASVFGMGGPNGPVSGLCREVPAKRHVVNSFRYFEQGPYGQSLHAFSVTLDP